MLKTETILVVLLFTCLLGYAQQGVNLKGMVMDTSGIPLPKASIFLLYRGDTLRELTREDGTFYFHVRQAGNFTLQVTMKGFMSFQKNITMRQAESLMTLPPIVLSIKYEQLTSVEVVKIRPLIKKEDTVTYNTGAYVVRPGSELERLLRQLPGIDWDVDGNLIFEGKIISRLMINGQNFTVGNLKTALQNLPADIIDKVQVIDDYGDKARLTGVKSGQPIEVLNVILKNDKQNGNTSKIEVGDGDKDRYSGNLFSDFFSGDRQFTINAKLANTSPSGNLHEKLLELGFTDKWNPKWSASAGISVWGDNHSSNISSIQNIYYANGQTNISQSNLLSGTNQNELLSYSQTYSPNAYTKLRINTIAAIYNNSESTFNNYSTSEQDSGFTKMTNGQSQIIGHTNSSLLGSDFYIEKTNALDKQKMTLEGSFRRLTKDPVINTYNQATIATDNVDSPLDYHYQTNIANTQQELSTKLTYYFPLAKKQLLELGYAWSYALTQDLHLMLSADSIMAPLIPVDSLNTNFSFLSTSNTFHAGFLTHTDKLDLTLSLAAQPGFQNAKTIGKKTDQSIHYFGLLPLIQLSYKLASSQKCMFEYNTMYTTPTLQQLEPATNLTNPQFSMQGNPMLKPSYTRSGSLRYELTSLKSDNYWGVSAGIAYKSISDIVIPSIIHPQNSNSVVQQTTYINANGFHGLSVFYQLTFPAFLHKYLKISTSGSINNLQIPTQTDSNFYQARSQTWNQSLQVRVDIPNKIETDLAASYSSTLSHYSSNNISTSRYPAFNWSFHYRQEFFQKWAIDNSLSQIFSISSFNRLQANPALANASIQRDLFARNQATISLSVIDMLNSSRAVSQSISPTAITQTWTGLVGRYFLITIVFKLEKFHSSFHSGLK